MSKKFLLVCDERFTRNWPSSSKTWAFGGYIVQKSLLKNTVGVWNAVKKELCGKENVDLKWSHFFPGEHQKKGNPLLTSNPNKWRELLNWGLGELCSERSFILVSVLSRKNRIPKDKYDFYFESSSKGTLLLKDQLLKTGVVALFALYLKGSGGEGEIWYDKLGSEKEERRVQKGWE